MVGFVVVIAKNNRNNSLDTSIYGGMKVEKRNSYDFYIFGVKLHMQF